MKKYVILVALSLICASTLIGCGKESTVVTEESAEVMDESIDESELVSMGNPWSDSSKEEMREKLGFEMSVPEGGSVNAYRINESDGIGELDFAYEGLEYTYRIKSAIELEDISGLYYEWIADDECQVGYCDGRVRRAKEDDITIDSCIWYDTVPGFTYSLSTQASDLDGFDILGIVGLVFEPMQGEVDGDESVDYNGFDEIIATLQSGQAYAYAPIAEGKDVLLVAKEGTYDNLDGNMATIDAVMYADDGKGGIMEYGFATSAGTAYPLAVFDGQYLMCGGNHFMNKLYIDTNIGSVVTKEYASVIYEEGTGNPTYSYLSLDNKSETVEEDDTKLNAMFEDYSKAEVINFTVIE